MKKILITGCSSGFGRDAARYLADQGHFVYATMRNVHSKNKEVAEEMQQYAEENNVKIEVHELDVTDDQSVNALAEKVQDTDVLINNAGLGYGGPLEAFSSSQIMDQLNLNIVGTARVAKAVLPGMRKRKSGLIIQVSSTAGRGAFPGFSVYHASKWGLEGMSEALRYELAPLGIDVVIVEPGPFDTNFFGNMVNAANDEMAEDYAHVNQFFGGFSEQVKGLFADDQAPTDPMIVVKDFEKLINMPVGSRPLRTISGLDFGLKEVNEATESIRQKTLQFMGITDWDGPNGL